MPTTVIDSHGESILISDYEGLCGKKEVERRLFSQTRPDIERAINFFRERDNNAYSSDSVTYEGTCGNNLVISPNQKVTLRDVSNAYILVGEGQVEIFPIFQAGQDLERILSQMGSAGIKYNIPAAVRERENLKPRSISQLVGAIRENYDLEVDSICRVDMSRAEGGVYYVGAGGKRYFLKFKGRNQQRAERIIRITNYIGAYFPRVIQVKGGARFTFSVDNEIWGLDEEASGRPKPRSGDYFSLLGTHAARLHISLSEKLGLERELHQGLISQSSAMNESNAVAMSVDLYRGLPSEKIVKELASILNRGLGQRRQELPAYMIHGDLNNSNVFWGPDGNVKIVDSETIKMCTRLTELEAALLLEGHMKKPTYVRGSTKEFLKGYLSAGGFPFTSTELSLAPAFLRYALIRNFVIRKIRRGIKDEDYLTNLTENLKKVDKDDE